MVSEKYDYQHGFCHYFADIVIKEIRKFLPGHKVNYLLLLAERNIDGELQESVLIHAYIKIKNWLLDSNGFHPLSDAENRLAEWERNEKITKRAEEDFETEIVESDEIPTHFFNKFCDKNQIRREIKEFLDSKIFSTFIEKITNKPIKKENDSITESIHRVIESTIIVETETKYRAVFVAGKETYKTAEEQFDYVSIGFNSTNIALFRYTNPPSDEFFATQRNIPIFLFSKGAELASTISAYKNVNKNLIYIIEPYNDAKGSVKNVISKAISNGVPTENVFLGPSNGRGKGILSSGFTPTPAGKDHFQALQHAGETARGKVGLNEEMSVDDWGRLHDEDNKILYPYKRIAKFLDWYEEEWGKYAKEQGWFVVTSDTDAPKVRYKPEEGNKYNLFFQVQRIDDPMEGEALFGKLKNDSVANELAKNTGLMLDQFGVVIGYDGESFLDNQ